MLTAGTPAKDFFSISRAWRRSIDPLASRLFIFFVVFEG